MKTPGRWWIRVWNLALAGALSQIGFIPVVAVVGAMLCGLWLDLRLGTRPVLTAACMIVGAALGLVVMVRAAMTAAAQFRMEPPRKPEKPELGSSSPMEEHPS
ncbi:AtpZ/AtpI family protein [Thermoflexus sp.]|uniref:AtpZ/AtpI family protein n=1 Tax=Thermoflexus sp. TaxID=1969742 RepID=UPI0025E19C65|nr:AtpZ/AtpI family protein [Thermoflexus sp.]MDW8179750.1 AtpZ/AtpI family protein [Anaerolineae bacterium]MCS6963586.1 AtpZ/AtpI family protein [Thermoflexus sp.]MCS7350299.1 AtpZ/AtpI family protein [Thermoflexus sp.]MCX7689624.1 AtpZ/AtpI family protein [Thermoflexus sp.]MDW8184694.1 AtpZ/AtpI family protein [Anaerolineae bacterium]